MSVKSRLTPTKALKLLKELAAERPDYVDPNASAKFAPNCKYAENGAPSCIVGNALARHGFALSSIAALDETEDGSCGADQIPDHLKLVSARAAMIFADAQTLQDKGKTWAEAVAHAEELARNVYGVKA